MIQRQQSLWLLLAAVASFLSFKFPFYTGNILENNASGFAELEGGSNFFLLIVTGLSILISVIAIFMYKDRKTQLKLAIGGIILSIIMLILYFVEIKKFEKGNFALTAIFVLAILIGYIMAARGIWKDEKLVKSLDKLR
jgi:predicted membrane channel-forming protein YqfA (hemolysin III family)